MKIVKCLKCNRIIYLADGCYYCGNKGDFQNILNYNVHDNVRDDYEKLDNYFMDRKYNEVIVLSHKIIEWMPDFSNVFFMRLLAKKKCSTVANLIYKGIDCRKDADFCNAISCALEIEKNVYVDIENLVQIVQKKLKEEVLKHERDSKLETNVLQLKSSMDKEISLKKETLISLWTDLKKIEDSMYILDKEYKLVEQEYRESLNSAGKEMGILKSQIYRLEECTAEELHDYQIKISCFLKQSEEAKDNIELLKKESDFAKSFLKLKESRDNKIQTIGNEIILIKKIEEKFQRTLNEIDSIEKEHRQILLAIDKFDFEPAFKLLGKEKAKQICHNIGLYCIN